MSPLTEAKGKISQQVIANQWYKCSDYQNHSSYCLVITG